MELQRINPVDLVTSPIGPEGPEGAQGADGPDNNFNTSNTNSIAPDGEGYLITTSTIPQYLNSSDQLYVKGSNPGYLDINTITKNGNTYKLSVTPSIFGAPVAWAAGSSALIIGHQGTSGLEIIERGNPGQASPLVLSSMNTVHHYTINTLSSFIDISTTMLENAIYEVYFTLKGASSNNNDLLLYPNYNTGLPTSTFYTSYQNNRYTAPTVPLEYKTSNASGFLFDLVGGSLGWDPVGKITIFNIRSSKTVRMDASDTTGIVHGSGYWTNGTGFSSTSSTNITMNTSTVWSNIGRFVPGSSFNSWNIWVRRIA